MTDLAAQIRRVLTHLEGPEGKDAAVHDQALQLARAAMQQQRADLALPVLDALSQSVPDRPEIALLRGYALRMEQRYPEAEHVFAQGHASQPSDAGMAFGLAQTRFELGLPAASAFAAACRLMPGNAEAVRNHAAALAAEGQMAAAQDLLLTMLTHQPEWLDGHKLLSTLRWTSGDQTHHADSYQAACRARPGHLPLWIAWFSAVAQTRDWPASLAILAAAEQALGPQPGLIAARFFVAVESGDTQSAEALLGQTASISGDVTALSRVRYFIRQQRYDAAQAVVQPLLQTPSAPAFWPYMSIIWRLCGDDRAVWLDRPDMFIRAMDLGLDAAMLDDLAALLRQLHTAQAPYVEQSVRGGTQTDRSVLLRHEPQLQALRTRLTAALRNYVADLPAPEPGHPVLGLPRSQMLIDGSWSVRLHRQGYNVPHSHPRGWLSTAFYVALPAAADMGPAPAGHIAFGTPPAELNTGLTAYRTIRPEPGRLAIFPSTMWHGTVPFEDGERLVIAFDIRPPAY